MGIFKKQKRPTSKQRKQARMRHRIASAPAPAPRRGTPEWKKARNARRRERARSAKRLREMNQERARAA